MDLIEYTESRDLPGAILLLDIQKAFDSVNHQYLLKVLKRFNFGDKFVDWIKTLYSSRKSYVVNNGFFTKAVMMERGIFQGCPISPYLFLLVIETMALAVRQNNDIKGIPVEGKEVKISLLADDSTCFLDGSLSSFDHLFDLLDNFAVCSGCKLNISKSEAIWVGAKRGSQIKPYSENGLIWKTDTFKTLGVVFSLDVSKVFTLNYKPKLKSIEATLNCWRARNLSLIGKICVVKTLLLPQLLYLFSVLCIKIPKKFFKELDGIFYKFIWSGGRDRVKRKYFCNDFALGGLRMIDPYVFAMSQKMAWVKLLLDKNYSSIWKIIELSVLQEFNQMNDILWKSHAPESVLNKLPCSQLSDSITTWYFFREKAIGKEFGVKFSDLGSCQCLWFNRNIRSKSKQFFFYQEWFDRGIIFVSDLLDPPLPGSKIFEELILDFGILPNGRRKFNFIMRNIPQPWLTTSNWNHNEIFDIIVNNLCLAKKVPKYVYSIMSESCAPTKQISFWEDLSLNPIPAEMWDNIHLRNFKSSIDARVRSFYFKLYHRAIALNDFLHKIKRKDSSNCTFCQRLPETVIHIYIECQYVRNVWDDIINVINHNTQKNFNPSNFEKIFGYKDDKFVTYIFLIFKYYIYLCKFRGNQPSFQGFKVYLKTCKDLEHRIAKKKGKLALHFRKWRFDI